MLVGGFQQRRFERLLSRHWDSLRRMAIRLTGDPDAGDDLLQDLVERATPHRDELLGLDNPRAWLARVLYRLFVDQWRHARAGPDVDPDAEVDTQPAADERDIPDAEFDRALTRERLQAALEQLSPGMRDVVLLHDLEGYTLVEIAGIVETPVGTLKSRLHRGRARLRGLLVDGTFSGPDS